MKRLMCLLSLAFCLVFASGFSSGVNAQTTQEIAKGNCMACQKKCEEVLTYCTGKGGKYEQANVTNALKDCVAACKMTDEFFARGSNLSGKAALFVSEAAINCAKSCESFKDDDKMNACANECRKTAGNCSKLR
jgi:hypothetical protein